MQHAAAAWCTRGQSRNPGIGELLELGTEGVRKHLRSIIYHAASSALGTKIKIKATALSAGFALVVLTQRSVMEILVRGRMQPLL
jgi:hypothetical protein